MQGFEKEEDSRTWIREEQGFIFASRFGTRSFEATTSVHLVSAWNSHLRSGNGVLGGAAGVAPALGRESLVVVLAEVHAELSPSIEVALGGDGSAAGTLLLPVADVLPEGRSTLDRRLVHLLVLPDVVGGAVAGDGTHLLALGRASTIAGVLLNVVLNQRVGGPAIDGDEDGSGLGSGLALEGDGPVGVRYVSLL